jgi:hypothetical protein
MVWCPLLPKDSSLNLYSATRLIRSREHSEECAGAKREWRSNTLLHGCHFFDEALRPEPFA